MLYRTSYNSPIGMITLLCDQTFLKGVWLENQRHFDQASVNHVTLNPRHPILIRTVTWLEQYFSGQRPDPHILPLSPDGTDFQRGVWSILLQIPYGESITYGAIAKELGIKSAQAVGGAVGRNPISIIIPCHRVLGANGTLTGYAGGIHRKQWLLDHEHIPHL